MSMNNNQNNYSKPSPPPRFKQHDIVIYNGQEAEVMKIIDQKQSIEITYPLSSYIIQRNREKVHPSQLQVFTVYYILYIFYIYANLR